MTRSPSAATVAVVGLGYVGLPTALALAARGARVIGLEAAPDRLEAIRGQRADLLAHDRTRLAGGAGVGRSPSV